MSPVPPKNVKRLSQQAFCSTVTVTKNGLIGRDSKGQPVKEGTILRPGISEEDEFYRDYNKNAPADPDNETYIFQPVCHVRRFVGHLGHSLTANKI